MMFRLPPQCTRKRPVWFARGIKKAMTNEVAFNFNEQIKASKKATVEAVKQTLTNGKQPEATQPETTSGESVSN